MSDVATRETDNALDFQRYLCREISTVALCKLSMKELNDFRDAMHIIGAVLTGLNCQPRFWDDSGRNRNAAGELLDSIESFFAGYEQAAVDVAKDSTPVTAKDVAWRAWTILGFATDMTDDFTDVAVLAAEAVRDKTNAAFRERYAEGRAA